MMPANLGTPSPSPIDDPRFQPGSYISNGHKLYWVIGYRSQPAPYRGAPFRTLAAEDCATGRTVQLDLTRVRRSCRQIDPSAYVP